MLLPRAPTAAVALAISARYRARHGDDGATTIELLLKALDTLPAAEREQVLKMLVRRGLTAPTAPPAPAWVTLGSGTRTDFVAGFGPSRGTGGEQQMVPVRFPTEQHAKLRDWCGENGYPMAAVVRGLVDRFLAEEAPAAATTSG